MVKRFVDINPGQELEAGLNCELLCAPLRGLTGSGQVIFPVYKQFNNGLEFGKADNKFKIYLPIQFP